MDLLIIIVLFDVQLLLFFSGLPLHPLAILALLLPLALPAFFFFSSSFFFTPST
jgi:hypothetical protein